eukprot:SM000366S13813  [mRNA]  locus=s366:11794:12375:+ [translate_table: standard]
MRPVRAAALQGSAQAQEEAAAMAACGRCQLPSPGLRPCTCCAATADGAPELCSYCLSGCGACGSAACSACRAFCFGCGAVYCGACGGGGNVPARQQRRSLFSCAACSGRAAAAGAAPGRRRPMMAPIAEVGPHGASLMAV